MLQRTVSLSNKNWVFNLNMYLIENQLSQLQRPVMVRDHKGAEVFM